MALIPYDDRDGWIWMQGKMVPWRDAKVHFLTHGLHYASSVFEGIRVYNGKPFKLSEHNARLLNSCEIMDMDKLYSVEQLNAACFETLKANNIKDGYLRPLAWRGPEQMGVAARASKTYFGIAAWEWPHYFSAELRDKGISVKTSEWRRPPANCAPVHAKAAGLYMICTLSKHAAEKAGYTDALMLDYRGYVAELTGANLFMVKNGELHTPITDCFLNGITRQTVIEIAKQKGLKVIERYIKPEELAEGEEFFATGTAAEVAIIGKIDARVIPIGPISKMLRDAYAELVRG